jgi:TRAP-type transport system periplasmic protein
MIRTLAVAGVALTALISSAAQSAELRFAFPAPPQSLVNVWGFTPWVNDVMADSKGTLDIKIHPGPGLGTFDTVYDRTAEGVIDISFGVMSGLSGSHPKTEVISIPFEVENPREGAIALQRLQDKGVLGDEWKAVKVLTLFAFGNPAIQTRDKEVKSLADIKGLKLGVGNRFDSDVLQLLDALPQSAVPPDLYMGIRSGIYNGAMIQWTAFQTFKLAEVTKYHFDFPMGAAGAFVVMNRNSYDKLPPEAKAAIDKHSGEPFARRMGDVITKMDQGARDQAKGLGGHVFHAMAPGDRKTWAPKVQPLIDAWVRSTPNGAEVLAAYRKEIADIRAAK